MREARRTEIKDLLDRWAFNVILREEVPDGSNVLAARFLLTIKSTEDGKINYEAKYVVGAHRDRLKHLHSSQTLQPSSTRLLLAFFGILGFDVWTATVTQAYLQSAEPLMRDGFLKTPALEFEIDPEQCLKLVRPLYGLCKSGDFRHEALDKRLGV